MEFPYRISIIAMLTNIGPFLTLRLIHIKNTGLHTTFLYLLDIKLIKLYTKYILEHSNKNIDLYMRSQISWNSSEFSVGGWWYNFKWSCKQLYKLRRSCVQLHRTLSLTTSRSRLHRKCLWIWLPVLFNFHPLPC